MELIGATLLAGPLGFLSRTRRQALTVYLLAWAIIFPVQTVIVHLDADPHGNDSSYWVVNAAILALGIGLNRLGHSLGQRRRSRPSRRPA